MHTANSSSILKITGLLLVFAVLWALAVSAEAAGGIKDSAETIQYLLGFVKSSNCTFIRNNSAHTAAEAAAHMQRKYAYFKDEIKTPEDFIRLTATRSLMTGKPYYVRLKTGEKITSEAWLLEALSVYRAKQKE